MTSVLDYDEIVMDGIPTEFGRDAVPFELQQRAMAYDKLLRVVWNPMVGKHFIIRRCEQRHVPAVAMANKHLVGWMPLMDCSDGVEGVKAMIDNMHIYDRWAQNGGTTAQQLEAKKRQEAEYEAAQQAQRDKEMMEGIRWRNQMFSGKITVPRGGGNISNLDTMSPERRARVYQEISRQNLIRLGHDPDEPLGLTH